nr:hypothetical protein UMIGIWAJ_UMIGIWAJ_CDS_0006 [Microvirus sp.]
MSITSTNTRIFVCLTYSLSKSLYQMELLV